MRSPLDMDTVQIEITNACINQCGNCTRFVGHHRKPFYMDFDFFKMAVDSMVDYPKMTGIMGGEPLLHPDFEKMCEYLHSKIPPERTGLWTCFPEGKEHYREIIAKTFGNIFLNDHTKEDIMHKPILVTPAEMSQLEEYQRWYLIDKCWAQMSWSASINPHGAFFCEIAASMSMLLGKKTNGRNEWIGWPVQPGWWKRVPIHFGEQIAEFCSICGLAMPLRKRCSKNQNDEISPVWLQELKKFSPKVKAGKYDVSDCKVVTDDHTRMASYKDPHYRDKIAERYGMFLELNCRNFQTAYLKRNWRKPECALQNT